MSEKGVDANYRFIAAYQEVNSRILQRQQALTLYVTLTASLLAALLALHPGISGNELPDEWLAFTFPVTTICLAFLNYKTERAITNLRSFLSSLERIANAHHQLPSYTTDPRWATGVNKVRRFHTKIHSTRRCSSAATITNGQRTSQRYYPARMQQRFDSGMTNGLARSGESVAIANDWLGQRPTARVV